MDQVINNLLRRLPEILAGLPLDWSQIPRDRQEAAVIIALHCVLNGPVGVNKQTTFPIVGAAKIKDLLGCTNSSWKGFCFQVASIVVQVAPQIDCTQRRLNGKYWPL